MLIVKGGYTGYYYGMIIKALLWSAGREPDIAIKDLKCSGQQVRLTIDNRTNSAITSEIELSTRPVSGAPVCHTGKFTRTLAPYYTTAIRKNQHI